MEETRADRSLPWCKQREAAPQSAKAFCENTFNSQKTLFQTNLTLREIDKTKKIMRPKVFIMTANLV